jgi:hypothetical protein
MTRKIVRSIIPIAPLQYDSAYVNQLARSLDNFIDEQRNPIVNLSNIPNESLANGLIEGDLYEANGFLKIVRANEVFGGTHLGTTAVGTVTVVIS